MTVEPVNIFDRVANAETRTQVEQKMGVSKRSRQIQQDRALIRES